MASDGTDAHHLIRAPSEPSVIIGVIEPKGERRTTVGQLETRHRDHLINNDSTLDEIYTRLVPWR